MSNKTVYRISIILFSLAALSGGWFFMNKMLERKEDKILGQTGQIAVDLAGKESTDTEDKEVPFRGQRLLESERIKVLKVWETGKKLVPHEPLKGQMDMGQAIAKGEEWIGIVEKSADFFPADGVGEFENTSAKLCSFEDKAEVGEEKISFWEIQYVNKELQIVLKIHALSGEVWDAEIRVKNYSKEAKNISKDEYGFTQELLKSAFPFFAAVGDRVYRKNNTSYMQNKTGSMFLLLKRADIKISGEPEIAVYKLWAGTEGLS